MGNHAEAVIGQEERCRFPAVRIQRPAVAQHDWLAVAWAPVFVIDLDAVAGGDGAGGFTDRAALGGSGLRFGGAQGSQRQGHGGGGSAGGVEQSGTAGQVDVGVHDLIPFGRCIYKQ